MGHCGLPAMVLVTCIVLSGFERSPTLAGELGATDRGPAQTIELRLSVSRKSLAAMEPIECSLRLTNQGSQPITFVSGEALAFCKFDIRRDERNKPIPLTLYGELLLRSVGTAKAQTIVLKPTEFLDLEVRQLNRVFDFSEGGHYTLSATASLLHEDIAKPRKVLSNSVQIEIREPSPAKDVSPPVDGGTKPLPDDQREK